MPAPDVQIDVYVENHGTIFMFTPMTPMAREWVAEKVALEPWQWMGASFAVDHRYALPLATEMVTQGLVVR